MMNVESLKKPRAFKQVYSRGKHAADKWLVLYALPNDREIHRLGLSVSKKVGGAVVRNRVKRWIREALRQMAKQRTSVNLLSYDYIIVARSETGSLTGRASYKTIYDSLCRLFHKLGLSI